MHRLIDNIHTKSVLKFTLPSVLMMLFLSLYTMVDGVFVARFVNEDALAAINIVYPFVSLIVGVGVMLASGGTAIVAQNLGEGQHEKAHQNLALIFLMGAVSGIILALVGAIFTEPIMRLLGSTARLDIHARDYLRILAIFAPFCILQAFAQTFLVAAGRPVMGLISIMMGGATNVLLDYIFIVPLNMGTAGAAWATGISYIVAGLPCLVSFLFDKKSVLLLGKPRWDANVMIQTCFNGSSEMVTNLSSGITTAAFNIVMLRLMGESGVAAITVILYAEYLLTAVYLGFSGGISPVFSYVYGGGNRQRTHKIFRISMGFIVCSSVLMFFGAQFLAEPILRVFLHSGSDAFALARDGFRLFSLSFIFMGLNIFASALFTAFSNGTVSAVISFLRTFVFILGALALLPVPFGAVGVWIAVPIAELLTFVVSLFFLKSYRKVYGY